jgi:hypothetical protein
MPFEGYGSVFDPPTRLKLQDVFEFVWLVVIDADLGAISRNELAALIVKAHNSGMQPEAIKDAVLYELKHQRRTLI